MAEAEQSPCQDAPKRRSIAPPSPDFGASLSHVETANVSKRCRWEGPSVCNTSLLALERLGRKDGDSQEEKESIAVARHKLALIRLCNGDVAAADRWLFMLGFPWRISARLVASPLPCPTPSSRELPQKIAVFDDALEDHWRQVLLHGFRSNAAFWKENKYWEPATKYFSYVLNLAQEGQGRHGQAGGIEAVVKERMMPRLFTQFPHLEGKIRFAEVWAHARESLNGHQFHYDCDENMIHGHGQLRNPLVSSILYLSPGTGGATVITLKTIGDMQHNPPCWCVDPIANRMVFFDGSLLHGVLPNPRFSDEKEDGDLKSGRRLTMMVGFWGETLQRSGPVSPTSSSFPCASMDVTEQTSWQKEFEIPDKIHNDESKGKYNSNANANDNDNDNTVGNIVASVVIKRVKEDATVRFVPRLYERVDPLHCKEENAAVGKEGLKESKRNVKQEGHERRSGNSGETEFDLEAEENAEERPVHFVDGYFVDDLDSVDEALLKALELNEDVYNAVLDNLGRNAQDVIVLLRLVYRALRQPIKDNTKADIADEAVVAISCKSVAARDYLCQHALWRELLIGRVRDGDQAAVLVVWNIMQSTSTWPTEELARLRTVLEQALPHEPFAAGGLAYIVEKDSKAVIDALLELAAELTFDPANAELLMDIKAALLNVVQSTKDWPQVEKLLAEIEQLPMDID